MKYSDVFPSKYLTAEEISGREIKVTILAVEVEAVGQDKENRPVAYFVKAKKGLVLNKTNFKYLASQFGADSDDWGGKEIVLFTVMTQGRDGQPTEGIRTKLPKVAVAPKPAPQSHDELNPPPAADSDMNDEIPF